MNELLALIVAGACGFALGAIFFGGLWWTVRASTTSRQPALLFGLSLLLRAGVVLSGFYLVAGAHWERLLLCLIGFASARLLATRLIRAAGRAPIPVAAAVENKTGHAP